MKTVTRRILTFSIWIGMLAGNQLLAQQSNLNKQPAHITPFKAMYVAQQQEAADNPIVNSTSTQPSPNSIPTPAATSQTQTNNAVPGTVLSNEFQSPEAVADDMPGIENGLWNGCEPGNSCSICGGGYCTPPLWYTEQGARILNRTAPRRTALTYEFSRTQVLDSTGQLVTTAVGFVDVLNTHSINYNVAPGYTGTIGRYLGRDASDRDDFLEFTYWGMNTWADSNFYDSGERNVYSITSDDGRFTYSGGGRISTHFLVDNNRLLNQPISGTPFFAQWGVGGFDHVDAHFMQVHSEMHDFELNLRLRPRGRPDQLILHPSGRWRRECQPGTFMSYLVGLRYMTVGDGFRFHSAGMVTVLDNITQETATKSVFGDYNIQTENDLLGFQIGTDIMFRRCKWAWGVRAKMGPYVNFSRNVKEIFNDPLGTPSQQYFFNDRFSQKRQKAALIGEVGFEATYKFRPNLIGRASYDFMWISGLALAPEQLTWNLEPSKNDTINTNGTIYAHGITLGLEWCW